MITVRADNRIIVANAKFAYLIQNYSSNVAAMEVSNTEPFALNTPILLSEVGQTDAEILKVIGISGTTITLGDVNNLATSTVYSHPESTRMIALPYDQIRFYWTDITGTIADEDPVFDANNPLSIWVALDPSSYYSTLGDPNHSQGFGWFQYRNSTTGEQSQPSNPIPYAGFSTNTVQQIFSDFDSLLNTNELKLVSSNEKFAWLNEALAIFKNKLNLTNSEYTVSTPQTISTVSGAAEYMLPNDFSDIVEITDIDGKGIGYTPVSGVLTNNGTQPNVTKYYLRDRYIGFSPTPTSTGKIYNYTYRAKSDRLTNFSTYIDLPDNAFYALKDHMMYRAYMKFNNPLATTYYQSFKNATDLFMQASVKRNANLDTWEISPTANA
jgi:hypothetical protein